MYTCVYHVKSRFLKKKRNKKKRTRRLVLETRTTHFTCCLIIPCSSLLTVVFVILLWLIMICFEWSDPTFRKSVIEHGFCSSFPSLWTFAFAMERTKWEGPGALGPRGVLPYISYIGMRRPKGYDFWAVLVWKRVKILTIMVWNRVWFLREPRECINVFAFSTPNE